MSTRRIVTSVSAALLAIALASVAWWIHIAKAYAIEFSPSGLPPVSSVPTDPFQRQDVDLVIAIDNSGSMCCQYPPSDPQNLRLIGAEQMISALAVDIHPRKTAIALETFGLGVQWLSDLTSVEDNVVRQKLARKLYPPVTTGWTDIAGALRRAYQELFESGRHNPANIPAVVMLTDGDPRPATPPNDREGIQQLLTDLTSRGAQVFVVLLRNPEHQAKSVEEWRLIWQEYAQRNLNIQYFEAQDANQLEDIYQEIRRRVIQEGVPAGQRADYDPANPLPINMPPNLLKAVLVVRKPNAGMAVDLLDPQGASIRDAIQAGQGAGGNKISGDLSVGYYTVFTLERPQPGPWTLKVDKKVSYTLSPESLFSSKVLFPAGQNYLNLNAPTEMYVQVVDEQGQAVNRQFDLTGVFRVPVTGADGIIHLQETPLSFTYDPANLVYLTVISGDGIEVDKVYEMEVTGKGDDGSLVNSVLMRLHADTMKENLDLTLNIPPTLTCADLRPHFNPPYFTCQNSFKAGVEFIGADSLDADSLGAAVTDPLNPRGIVKLTLENAGQFSGSLGPITLPGRYNLRATGSGRTKEGLSFTRYDLKTTRLVLPAWIDSLERRLWLGAILLAILAVWKPVLVWLLLHVGRLMGLAPKGYYMILDLQTGLGTQTAAPQGGGISIFNRAVRRRRLFGLTIGRGPNADISVTLPSSPLPIWRRRLSRIPVLGGFFGRPESVIVGRVRVVSFRGPVLHLGGNTYDIASYPTSFQIGDSLLWISTSSW